MPNQSTSELSPPTAAEAFAAELELAFNFAKFAAAATDPDLAGYVHGKARESYQRLDKWSGQACTSERTRHALHLLQRRLEEFQRPTAGLS